MHVCEELGMREDNVLCTVVVASREEEKGSDDRF
jgi:hypothetical protein